MIRWKNRYSDTMEDDKQGRWAIVGYSGDFGDEQFFGFKGGRVCQWEIAWIKKFVYNDEIKFTVSYLFPSNGSLVFDTIEEAQDVVEDSFDWFIKNCK